MASQLIAIHHMLKKTAFIYLWMITLRKVMILCCPVDA